MQIQALQTQSQLTIYNAIKGKSVDTSKAATIDIYFSGGVNISNLTTKLPSKQWAVLTIWDDIGITGPACTTAAPCVYLRIMTYMDYTTDPTHISMVQISIGGACSTIQDANCISIQYSDTNGAPAGGDIPPQIVSNAIAALPTATGTTTCVAGETNIPGIGCQKNIYLYAAGGLVALLLLTRR